ncbi:MAG: hypothetical protein L0Y54_01250, partial [Sporichthyaceae bacterium]|nr:hypothetical protein [Sporichthyaceae bacterium]
MHDAMIVLHATAGVVGFVAALFVLGLDTVRSVWLAFYVGGIVGMTGFVAAAVAAGWPDHDTGTRITFGALLGLAG